MITVYNVPQGSSAWHKLRKDKWTGSRAIKLLQGKPLPDDSGTYQNAAMRRGSVLEPLAIMEYERETEVDVLKVGFVTNAKYPTAGYSPDGVVGDMLLEVKCCNGKRHENLVNGDIPLEYLAQIHFGMVICELERAQLIAFNPEYTKQLTIIDIERNPSIEDNIKARLEFDMKNRRY